MWYSLVKLKKQVNDILELLTQMGSNLKTNISKIKIYGAQE